MDLERPRGLQLLDIFGIHVSEELWFSLSRRGRSDLARTLLQDKRRLEREGGVPRRPS